MIDILSLKAAVDSLKIASDLARGIVATRDENVRNEKARELTSVIIDVQQKTLEALNQLAEANEQVRNLEQHIEDMDTWATEKQRYELVEAGGRGRALVYRLKASERTAGQPEHFICPKCYEDGHARILQRHVGPALEWFTCLTCDAAIWAVRAFIPLPKFRGFSRE